MKKKNSLKICYHGTKKENVEQILKTGFRPNTYFALHLEDALEYGGEHIFEVCFQRDVVLNDNWQFVNVKTILPDKIVRYRVINDKIKLENKKLSKKIFESNI